MKCKFCEAQLEDGVLRCPECGANLVAETTEEEAPVKKKITSGKLAVIYILVIVLLASLIAPVIVGMQNSNTPSSSAEGTVPADGNKDDVTCQGSYTASEKTVKAKADKVIATAGDAKLTNEMLQSIYWMQVYNYLGNYGTDMIDTSRPLDQQVCALSQEGWTWQQYFLNVALQEWQMYNAFTQEAKVVGYEATVDVEALLESMESDLNQTATDEGFVDAEQMVQYDMGPGASLNAYLQFLALTETGYDYYGHLYNTLAPTEDQIRTYYEENITLFEDRGVTDDGSVFVDVRHILLQPADKANEQDWVEAEKNAQNILDQWLAGEASEESFAALANEHSTDGGSNTKGGLYQYVQPGQMVAEFNDWCFDESRQIGDYGIVKTTHGYHIMYFVKSQPVWYVYAENSAKSQLLQDTMAALMEKYPADVDYSKIVLGESQYILTY